MDHRTLDGMIRDLQFGIPRAPSILFAVELHDWKPLFALAKEIQAGFNSKIQYPTRAEREKAWVEFNDARKLLFERANAERSALREESKRHRDDILSHVKHTGYSKLTDMLFFFDPTTVEEMKRAGRTLKEGGEMLSRLKGRMLKEHKDECFARFQELRAEQDVFWEQYSRQRAVKQAEFKSRMSDQAAKIRANSRSNAEKLDKARGALERVEENIEANREKLASARSSEFADRVSGWIAEGEERRRSIKESIQRIEEWIKEDDRRLDEVLRRMSTV
jgi:hypothetical protein